MCANRSKPRVEATASSKRRRAKPRKVAAQSNQLKPTKHKNPNVIDLTADEEEEEEEEHKVEVETSAMDVPAHLESDDYFEVLNLQRSASDADVKRAYRKLAVQWHPDKNRSHPRAEEFFKKISEAYEVLSDREKRKIYESRGRDGLDAGARAAARHPRGAEDPFAFGGGFSTQHARDIFDAFFGGQDPFEAFFGGTGTRQRRGSNQRRGRFGEDPFEAMGFGGMGFGGMGGMSMMDSFFSEGFGGMERAGSGFFSTSTSSSSSTFTDRNGHVVTQKTTTTTGADGRTETVTEEYRNGKLVNSTSSTGSRLADAGRMQLEGGSTSKTGQSNNGRSYQRRASSNSRPKY
ncbi:hypothetical protein PR003_g14238 [Phytophthora rubi]|uniref:J domain-containing protein n=1 Tax=Phytophthora rubi TaxID=129364 RepID=A0A6A3M787_9STRA|nr:hypothetical protein PR002_g13269 [Phytophthora rubi]KAE9026258.1 hypothetical protein PR001_g12230 [Phytophthora rubi]KAE9333015.1 hypothetical protein PR003_g14238 [Phytophthora rubi]